jgi:hypothetical protein
MGMKKSSGKDDPDTMQILAEGRIIRVYGALRYGSGAAAISMICDDRGPARARTGGVADRVLRREGGGGYEQFRSRGCEPRQRARIREW